MEEIAIKRLFATILILILLVSLIACKKTDSGSGNVSGENSSQENSTGAVSPAANTTEAAAFNAFSALMGKMSDTANPEFQYDIDFKTTLIASAEGNVMNAVISGSYKTKMVSGKQHLAVILTTNMGLGEKKTEFYGDGTKACAYTGDNKSVLPVSSIGAQIKDALMIPDLKADMIRSANVEKTGTGDQYSCVMNGEMFSEFVNGSIAGNIAKTADIKINNATMVYSLDSDGTPRNLKIIFDMGITPKDSSDTTVQNSSGTLNMTMEYIFNHFYKDVTVDLSKLNA